MRRLSKEQARAAPAYRPYAAAKYLRWLIEPAIETMWGIPAYADHPRPPGAIPPMEFRTRSKSRVLDDLVEKLRQLPRTHPDRARLIRMIIGLSDEIGRRLDDKAQLFAADD